ncbi:hypothetical protein AB0H07_46750 [Streptomyces sp. NPDC021354]|uniref:hypothetical protein n=1 Tax=Streptomyces sp. NPDC021354 TaxID=3154793 RepID=UPI0033CE809E
MISKLFAKRPVLKPAPAAAPHACEGLDGAVLPFSPLITELIAMNAHTRHLSWLAQREQCPDEFRTAAHALLSELLQAWKHQTGGCGSIDDLLHDPRPLHSLGVPAPRNPAAPHTVGARDTH